MENFNGCGIDKAINNRIILKYLPNELTTAGLENMCKRFGDIVEVNKIPFKGFAFITYESEVGAQKAICALKNEFENCMPIKVELAKSRKQYAPRMENHEEEAALLVSTVKELQNNIDSDYPIRNELKLDQRRIRGPFSLPSDINIIKQSLICAEDYDNIDLLKADPSKEFLWNSYDVASFGLVANNGKTIICGRAIVSPKKKISATLHQPNEKFIFTGMPDSKITIHPCVKCQLPADKECAGCFKSYCSSECIQNDVNHSQACHSEACKIENNNTIKPNVPIQTDSSVIEILPKKIDQKAKITCILNHRLVFIRPAMENDDIEFVMFINDTIKYAKQVENMKSLPKIGTLCLAEFGGFYQRALVMKCISKFMVVVALIDFGNVETKAYSELKPISNELKQKKRFATKVTLNQVNDDLMNEEALQYLYNIMAFDETLKVEFNSNNNSPHLSADLFLDEWVNEKVNKFNVKDIVINETGPIDTVELKEYDDKVENIPVMITDNSLFVGKMFEISFIHHDDVQNLIEIDKKVQAVCKYLFGDIVDCYTPRDKEYCVVKEKNRWYRAVCLEIAYDGFATLELIDYGCVSVCEITYIRRLPFALKSKVYTTSTVVDNNEEDGNKRRLGIDDFRAWSQKTVSKLEYRSISNFPGDQHYELHASFK